MNQKTILKNELEKEYFHWLCEYVDCRFNLNSEALLLFLYSKVFYSLVPNDDNRLDDGLQLRKCFAEEKDIPDAELQKFGPGNVLEVMIALAGRMGFILYDLKTGDHSVRWFWMLINNLRLKPHSKANDSIIKNLLERKYASNGDGGLFPIRNSKRDQREVEIWYQMMDYIRSKNL